jgi:inner membrane transporter RhtA
MRGGGSGVAEAPRERESVPLNPRAIWLVLGAATSVQFGAALAATLFDQLGPGGTVWLRLLFAALILLALWRPRLSGRPPRELALVVAFGLALAVMNTGFYEAIDRIPLGICVTIEFIGPLGLAVALSRRPLDAVWIALAAAGILLLARGTSEGLDGVGLLFAVIAGCAWAVYILLSARVGKTWGSGTGLAVAMAVGAIVVAPLGMADGGGDLLDPALLAQGVAVAVLSSAIPYSLELEALRRIPAGVFGVLMSLEPAIAAVAGFLVLGQDLVPREILGIAAVVTASAGAARTARRPTVVD